MNKMAAQPLPVTSFSTAFQVHGYQRNISNGCSGPAVRTKLCGGISYSRQGSPEHRGSWSECTTSGGGRPSKYTGISRIRLMSSANFVCAFILMPVDGTFFRMMTSTASSRSQCSESKALRVI